jgi:hypothetical protein
LGSPPQEKEAPPFPEERSFLALKARDGRLPRASIRKYIYFRIESNQRGYVSFVRIRAVNYLIWQGYVERSLAPDALDGLTIHESNIENRLNLDELPLLTMATCNGADFGRLFVHWFGSWMTRDKELQGAGRDAPKQSH